MGNNLLANVGGKLSTFAGKTKLKLEKRSPEIFMVVGAISFIGTIVAVSKATLEIDKIMDSHEEKVDQIHETTGKMVTDEDGKEKLYDEEIATNDIKITTVKTAVAVAKACAPAAGLAAVSITSFLVSNRILKKRYLGALAWGKSISKAFKVYRDRVIEEGGAELDRHYMFGTKYEQVEQKVTDEKGKTKKVTETQEIADSGAKLASPYARVFDSSNKMWDKNAEFTMMFLRTKESYFNNLLQTRGYVFLNEVYEELGFKATTNGQFVGWIKGDGVYVDFGLMRYHDPAVREYINGERNVVPLDFNIDEDSVIVDKI